jgi:hypothetical protein
MGERTGLIVLKSLRERNIKNMRFVFVCVCVYYGLICHCIPSGKTVVVIIGRIIIVNALESFGIDFLYDVYTVLYN